jgi:hypothetical protein
MRLNILALAAAAALAPAVVGGCAMHGVPSEDGTINLGPNALGDDPVGHRTYPSFAEYAYATHQLKDLEKDGLTKEQQICWADALMDNLPNSLSSRLNAYARNEVTLMESEYAKMMDELTPFLKNEEVAKSTYADFKAKCA